MRKEIAILVAVAVGSMALGFLLVLVLVGPGDREKLPDPFAPGSEAAVQQPAAASPAAPAPANKADAAQSPAPAPAPSPAVASTEGTWAIDPLVKKTDAAQAADVPAPDAAQAAATAPAPAAAPAAPSKYAGKIALAAGTPFIWRCFPEGSDSPLEKDACGTLSGVDGLVSGSLGAVEQCVIDSLGTSATGTLSLALKIDYTGNRVKAWLGNSTKIEKMEAVSGCIRTAMEGAKPPAVDHTHAVYIVFVTIGVGN